MSSGWIWVRNFLELRAHDAVLNFACCGLSSLLSVPLFLAPLYNDIPHAFPLAKLTFLSVSVVQKGVFLVIGIDIALFLPVTSLPVFGWSLRPAFKRLQLVTLSSQSPSPKIPRPPATVPTARHLFPPTCIRCDSVCVLSLFSSFCSRATTDEWRLSIRLCSFLPEHLVPRQAFPFTYKSQYNTLPRKAFDTEGYSLSFLPLSLSSEPCTRLVFRRPGHCSRRSIKLERAHSLVRPGSWNATEPRGSPSLF